jgi:NADPH:quinone reductase-like Zn-dependent oxidoreductase
MDAAGTLAEIGPDVATDLAVGDAVVAVVVPSGSHGAYREDLVVPAASVARAPAGADAVAASTLPMNGLTARLALDRLQLQPGQVLVVSGAAGAFGGYVVQLASAEGLTVVADASEADESLVRRLGADVVLRRGDGFADRVLERFPDGVDGVADGALLHEALTSVMRDGGRFVTVRGWEGDGRPGVEFLPVWVRRYAENAAALDRLRQQVEEGVLTLRVAETFPAERAAEAHRRLEAGGVRGRLVLTF